MMKLSAILFVLVKHCVLTLNINQARKEKSKSKYDCDFHFKNIKLDLEMMMKNAFLDDELSQAYEQRTKDLTSCLNFFPKYLIKLDENLTKEDENQYIAESEEQYFDLFLKRDKNKIF